MCSTYSDEPSSKGLSFDFWKVRCRPGRPARPARGRRAAPCSPLARGIAAALLHYQSSAVITMRQLGGHHDTMSGPA